MKLIIQILFLIISVSGIGQSNNQKFDDLKFFTSPFSSEDLGNLLNHQISFDSIVQASPGVFIKVKITKETSYWENGNLRFQRFYKKNKPFGKWTYYQQSGNLKYTLHNYSGYFHIKLHYQNQNIQSLRRYNTNLKSTVVGCREEAYYPNGSMQSYGNKKAVKRTGNWVLVESGKWYYFFPSGQMESKGKYKNGEKTGNWINYNQNGEKIRTSHFKDGVLIWDKKVTP